MSLSILVYHLQMYDKKIIFPNIWRDLTKYDNWVISLRNSHLCSYRFFHHICQFSLPMGIEMDTIPIVTWRKATIHVFDKPYMITLTPCYDSLTLAVCIFSPCIPPHPHEGIPQMEYWHYPLFVSVEQNQD